MYYVFVDFILLFHNIRTFERIDLSDNVRTFVRNDHISIFNIKLILFIIKFCLRRKMEMRLLTTKLIGTGEKTVNVQMYLLHQEKWIHLQESALNRPGVSLLPFSNIYLSIDIGIKLFHFVI